MRRIISIGLFLCLAGLWGCGGGSNHQLGVKAALQSDCSPSPLSAGDSVECPITTREADALQDCTFFVKTGFRKIPVETELTDGMDNETTVIAFQMPAEAAGSVDLLVGCGDRFKTLASLTISDGAGASEGDSNTIAPERTAPVADTTPAGSDVVIVPSAPAAAPAVPPSSTETPEPPSTPTVPAAPATPAALTVSIAGSLVSNPVRAAAAHVAGHIQGGGTRRTAYVYGPFAPDGNCHQLLAIDPSGGPLNPGSVNYQHYQNFVGVRCDEAAGNCEGFSSTASDGTPSPVNCRIDLNPANDSVDFYFRLSQTRSTSVLVAQAEDGTVRTAESTLSGPSVSVSNVRVAISQTAPEFTVSFSYANAASAPVVTGCNPTGAASSTGGGIGNAHCALENGATVTVTASGTGSGAAASETYRIQCGEQQSVLKKMSFTPAANATGAVSEVCAVSEPNWGRTCDSQGELELRGEAWRACDVQKQGSDGSFQTIATQSVPWVNQVKLTEVAGGACTTDNDVWVDVTPDMAHSGRAILTRRLKRSHECTHYAFSVKGEDGHEVAQHEEAPFQGSFQLLADTSYQFEKVSQYGGYCADGYFAVPGMDAGHYCGYSERSRSEYICHDSNPKGASFKVSWMGRHIKRISYQCTTSGYGSNPANLSGTHVTDRTTGRELPIPTTVTDATLTQPNQASYDLQTAADGFVIRDGLLEVTVTCDFTAVTTEDEEIHQTFTWDLGC